MDYRDRVFVFHNGGDPMNNWFFTGDLHLGHEGIIGHVGRPHNSDKEMNEDLIRNWNNCVRPQDNVVHVGDFCLGYRKEAEGYLEQLNGNIIMLKGNHDHWMGGHRYEWHKKVGGMRIYATHYPLRTWPRHFANGWNLHGHCHANLKDLYYNQLDVGVDRAMQCLGAFRPFSFEEVNTWVLKQNEEWLKNNKLPKRKEN